MYINFVFKIINPSLSSNITCYELSVVKSVRYYVWVFIEIYIGQLSYVFWSILVYRPYLTLCCNSFIRPIFRIQLQVSCTV